MPIAYQFLPWVRRGLTVALTQTETLGNIPARATAQIGVKLAGAHAGTAITPLPMQLYGPGDVIGIDSALVVRTDPRPGTTNFEPNYLAIVDFDPPDFPWMLTPAKANADDRLRPWLVLVVLEKNKVGTPKMAGPSPLPQIRVPAAHVAAELPPLGESWSWAHAQVVSEAAANDVGAIQADLQGNPANNISRLVCPRRLKPDTDYVACVVPAFEPGRLRGLGLAGDGSLPAMQTLAPAWNNAANADVVLPVYHHWEFSTSAAGDFEYLARKLRSPMKWKDDPQVAELLRHIGTMPMSVDDLLNGNTPGPQTIMEGALVPIGYETGTPPEAMHATSLRVIVNTPADQVDNPVVDEADGRVRRIEVKPPLYGAWHAKAHSVNNAQIGGWWLAGLNLTPRYRGAAGYGGEVVRKHQEDYVDACWDQVGAILDAEMKFNLTRLAIEAQRHLKAKHFDVLPPERLLQVMGSALPRIEALNAQGQAAFKVNGVTASIGGQVDRTSLPAAMVDAGLRRIASPQQRRLRTAAMRTRTLAQLPALSTQYVKAMAGATTKAAVFAVNTFMPDGIAGTKLFDGVNLNAERVDLRSRGLRNPLAATLVKQALAATTKAQEIATGPGVGLPKVRAGMTKGIFTDVHVQRFGALVASTPSVQTSDFGLVATQIEVLGRRGVEGFLVEAQIDGGQMQFSAMQIDARSGALRLDKPLLRFSPDRRATRPARAEVTRASGMSLGGLPLADARRFDNISLFSSLPANTLDLQGSSAAQFQLSAGLELTRIGQAPPSANVASITLPPALRNRTILKRFADATRGTQALWRDAYVAQRVEVQVVDFPLTSSAAIVRARTQPDITLAARLASQVSIAEAAFGKTSAHVSSHLLATTAATKLRFVIPALFDRVMAFPHLREPMYRALADYDPEAFMPGIGNLPPDLIMLVQVNQAFIDSYMVGANFEMNRELLWRGFPTDLRGTPFQRFWGRVNPRSDGTVEALDDMEPIHLWGQQKLGARIDPNITDPDRVALIIKGRLLLRYPNTAVYAWKRLKNVAADKSKLVQPPVVQTPVFAGFIKPDVTFFGFDIDRGDIEDWCFVVEEQMTEPRFGFDVPLPAGGGAGAGRIGAKPRAALQTARAQFALGNAATPQFKALKDRGFNPWKALSWSDLKVDAGAHVSIGALAALSQPANQPFANFPGLVATPTAAEIAQALLQEPFRAYWEGPDLVMPPPP